MSSALGMNLMPPTSAFQHAGAGSASSGVLQKQSDDQDSNSATEVTKDNIEEEVQEKRKLDQLTSHIIVSNYSYKTVQKCFSCLVGRILNTLPYMNDQ